jgi:hypothetical protein
MGREVKRVPLDFSFPLNESFHDDAYRKHMGSCPRTEHDGCEYSYKPPEGEGWQLWQTVSDGPVTPVFATAEELIEYMSQPVPRDEQGPYDPGEYPEMPGGKGWRHELAEKFVKGPGWAPTFIAQQGEGLEFGPTAVVRGLDKKA